MDWIDEAQDWDRCQASVNTVMNLRVPLNVGNLATWESVSYSRRKACKYTQAATSVTATTT
jgi:hypothetical protein